VIRKKIHQLEVEIQDAKVKGSGEEDSQAITQPWRDTTATCYAIRKRT